MIPKFNFLHICKLCHHTPFWRNLIGQKCSKVEMQLSQPWSIMEKLLQHIVILSLLWLENLVWLSKQCVAAAINVWKYAAGRGGSTRDTGSVPREGLQKCDARGEVNTDLMGHRLPGRRRCMRHTCVFWRSPSILRSEHSLRWQLHRLALYLLVKTQDALIHEWTLGME